MRLKIGSYLKQKPSKTTSDLRKFRLNLKINLEIKIKTSRKNREN